jgi:hypothetical protein
MNQQSNDFINVSTNVAAVDVEKNWKFEYIKNEVIQTFIDFFPNQKIDDIAKEQHELIDNIIYKNLDDFINKNTLRFSQKCDRFSVNFVKNIVTNNCLKKIFSLHGPTIFQCEIYSNDFIKKLKNNQISDRLILCHAKKHDQTKIINSNDVVYLDFTKHQNPDICIDIKNIDFRLIPELKDKFNYISSCYPPLGIYYDQKTNNINTSYIKMCLFLLKSEGIVELTNFGYQRILGINGWRKLERNFVNIIEKWLDKYNDYFEIIIQNKSKCVVHEKEIIVLKKIKNYTE